jgi:hypothetical protein
VVLWRSRNGVQRRRFVRPDEEHATRRVVHDKPGGAAEAVRTEPRMVAVPSHDEEGGIRAGRDHLTFGTTAAAFSCGVSAKPGLSSREQRPTWS